MNQILLLLPVALLLGLAGLVSFLWSLKNGQYDDLDGAVQRMLAEDDDTPAA
jgi:cbb3-type cytochrome oxidase maturation protein